MTTRFEEKWFENQQEFDEYCEELNLTKWDFEVLEVENLENGEIKAEFQITE